MQAHCQKNPISNRSRRAIIFRQRYCFPSLQMHHQQTKPQPTVPIRLARVQLAMVLLRASKTSKIDRAITPPTKKINAASSQPEAGKAKRLRIVFRACRAHLARPDLLRQWVLHVGQNFCGSWICSGVFISKKSGETPRPIVLWLCQNLRIPRIYHSTESSFLRI